MTSVTTLDSAMFPTHRSEHSPRTMARLHRRPISRSTLRLGQIARFGYARLPSIRVDPANSTPNVYLWANACKGATSDYFVLSSLTQCTAFPSRPAISRRQALRFTRLVGPWLSSWLAPMWGSSSSTRYNHCCREGLRWAKVLCPLSRSTAYRPRCGDLGPWAQHGRCEKAFQV
jgi:hypothetical protein